MNKSLGLCFAALVAVILFASGVAFGQYRLLEREYRLIPGEDVGFRVEGTDGSGRPFGTLMLRMDGEWVEVGSMGRTRFLSD